MDLLLIGILGVVALVVLLFLGVHVAIALAAIGLGGLTVVVGFDSAIWLVTTTIYYKIASYALITVPLFILMGLLAAGGGVSTKLYDGLSLWLGKMKSGLGIATVLACTGFGAVTGSSIVTAAVFAKISAPEMRRHGYDKRLAYGICASAGGIGMLIPPSVLAILYGILSGLSIGKLLIAGVGPGLLMAILYCAGIVGIGRIRPDQIKAIPITGVTWRQRFAVIPSFWPIVVTAAIILGGIFSGFFTPTEAGAVAAFVLAMLVIAVNRRQSPRILTSALTDAATMSCMVFIILAGACVFSRFMILTGITDAVLGLIVGANLSNLLLVVLLTVFYLAMGTLLDSISMISITIPVLVPILGALGIDPIWFAMIVITATQVGIITPPVGLSVYTSKAVAEPDVTLEDIFAGVVPFLVLGIVLLVVLIVFPEISTVLPQWMID